MGGETIMAVRNSKRSCNNGCGNCGSKKAESAKEITSNTNSNSKATNSKAKTTQTRSRSTKSTRS